MLRIRHVVLLLAAAGALVSSCRKKDDPTKTTPPLPTKGKVTVTIQHVADAQPFALKSWFMNANGDSLSVKVYKYYLSNFVLIGDSANYTQPESYFLVDEGNASSKLLTIDNLPPGTYTKMQFLIGVDRSRNTSGAQTGALDPANGMFWDWNSGYIMAKMEGQSPQATTTQKAFSYHMLGFKSDNSVLREVTLTLPTPVIITGGKSVNIHMKGNILEWFKTPVTISIGTYPIIASEGIEAANMAANYQDMFVVDHIE